MFKNLCLYAGLTKAERLNELRHCVKYGQDITKVAVHDPIWTCVELAPGISMYLALLLLQDAKQFVSDVDIVVGTDDDRNVVMLWRRVAIVTLPEGEPAPDKDYRFPVVAFIKLALLDSFCAAKAPPQPRVFFERRTKMHFLVSLLLALAISGLVFLVIATTWATAVSHI